MVDLVYSDGLKALQQRMGTLFNNVKFSDTVFTVKNQKFYALSQLVAVASGKLDSVISEHFAHCDDKEITLYDVKCQESFSIVLQYMYGLDINFSQMKMSVLCEVINLAENYQLTMFSKDLKNYLSKIDTFELDSLTVLLNTARKYNLNDLYERLKVFAFEHAADFVKHESIIKLQYEVLLNLIKSDWFCAPEIDILVGVLNWHNEMTTKKSKETPEKDCGSDSDGGNQDVDMETDHSYANVLSDNEDNNQEENQDLEEEDIEHVEEEVEDFESEEQEGKTEDYESGINNLNEHNSNSEVVTSNKRSDCAELVKLFSNNVLKSLLLHVRVKQITLYDHLKLSQTSLFKKYKHMFQNDKYFSQTSESRQKYGTVVNENRDGADGMDEDVPQSNKPFSSTEHGQTLGTKDSPYAINIPNSKLLELHNIKRTIRVETRFLFVRNRYEKDILLINNNFIWNIVVTNSTFRVDADVQCSSYSKCNWECTAECELTLIAPFKGHSNKVLPVKSLLFDNHQYSSSQRLGDVTWTSCKGWYDAFKSRDFIEFEINFKSITIKKK
uniref:BTB/POZ domain-containing protein 9 n=1 Tax=Cacopsylla melanoneura TaxID=428564 RepID=A0A8D8T4X6_9HEMI